MKDIIIWWKLRVWYVLYKLGGVMGLDFDGAILQEDLGTDINQCNAYTPASPAVKLLLEELSINANDCILDVGCGKGKAMSYMMGFPFKKIGGLDISEKLIGIAEKNFSILKQKHRVNLYICNASCFEDYDSYNYLFFYNPFPRAVMELVKERILESLERVPRELVIIYENSVDRDLFETGEFLWKEYMYDLLYPQPIVVYRYMLHKK